MDSSDNPNSFPLARGDPRGRSKPRVSRGRWRYRKSPAWVNIRLPALPQLPSSSSSYSSSITTTSITTSSMNHRHQGTLQPITRFSSQEIDAINNTNILSLMDSTAAKNIMLLLKAAKFTKREQIFWMMQPEMCEFLQRRLLHYPWVKAILRRSNPGVHNDLALCLAGSHYHHAFEELNELGRGGFGKVVRAKKKIDGCHYAVKIIVTEDLGKASLDTCMSEVRTLAKLDHRRVVRYFDAWVEDELFTPPARSSATLTEYESGESEESSSESNSESSHSTEQQESNTPAEESIVFHHGSTSPHSIPHRGTGEQGRAVSLLPRRSNQSRQFPRIRKVLYIQMMLYGKSLRDWLDRRNSNMEPVVEEECLRIFKHVVEAVIYIHQQGIMHRDIKPANIFFSRDGHDVHLGDFGLARLLPHRLATPPSGHASQGYTLDVGTPLYLAPEVKEGTYGEKSDIYSMGIVLLELFKPFGTISERVHVINKLKNAGDLDLDLTQHCCIVSWIKKLTDKEPSNRPSANELLRSSLFHQPVPPSPITPTNSADIMEFPVVTHDNLSMEVEASVRCTRSEYTIQTRKVTVRCKNKCPTCTEELTQKDEEIFSFKKENEELKKENKELKKENKELKKEKKELKKENKELERKLRELELRQESSMNCNALTPRL